MSPTVASGHPSSSPTTDRPTTGAPTSTPTGTPFGNPSRPPTWSPSESPSESPTETPTESPSGGPTIFPTTNPTVFPTVSSTARPTTLSLTVVSSHPTAALSTTTATGTPTAITSTDMTSISTENPTVATTEASTETSTGTPTTLQKGAPPSDFQTVTPTAVPSPSHVSTAACSPSTPCCLGMETNGRFCLELLSSLKVEVGSVCMKLLNNPSLHVEFNFRSSGVWTLLETHLWVGDDAGDAPVGITSYPYNWQSTKGDIKWNVTIAFDRNASVPTISTIPIFTFVDVLVGRTFSNGTVIPLTEERVQALSSNAHNNTAGQLYFQNSIQLDCNLIHPNSSQVQWMPPGVCLQTPDLSGSRCFPLTTVGEVTVGETCVKIDSVDNMMKVTAHAQSGWTLVDGKFWVGSDRRKAPSLNYNSSFPHYWANPTVKELWVDLMELPLGTLCKDNRLVKLYGKTLLKVARDQYQSNKFRTISEEQFASVQFLPVNSGEDSAGLFDIMLLGRCDAKSGRAPASLMGLLGENTLDPSPTISIEDKECWPMLTGAVSQAGMVCLEIAGEPRRFEVTFQTEGIFQIVDAKLWIGKNVDEARIFAGLDYKDVDSRFPYYWFEPTGATRWSANINTNETDGWCIGNDSLIVFFVARAKVARTFANGTLIPGTVESVSVGRTSRKRAAPSSLSNFTVQCKASISPPTTSLSLVPACLDTRDQSGKICFSLQTIEGFHGGVICLSVQQGNPTALHARFTSDASLVLVKAHIWAGPLFESIPLTNSSGSPDLANFPKFWSNSSGRLFWDTDLDVDLSSICKRDDRFKLYVVAHAVVEQVSRVGVHMRHTRSTLYAQGSLNQHPFGWFEIPVICDCGTKGYEEKKDDLILAKAEPNQEVCFASPHGTLKRCFTLLVAGRAPGGSVCLELVDNPLRQGGTELKVTFKAVTDFWGILKSVIWTGLNLADAPKVDVRNATQEQFPIFRYNSSADQLWTYAVPLNVTENCANNRTDFELFVLAQSVVTRVDKKGKIIQPMTKHAAIAVDPEWTPPSAELRKGFGLTVECDCKYGKARRKRELEIYPDHQHKSLY